MEDQPLESALPLSADEIERNILTALGHIMTEQYRWKIPKLDLADDPYRPEIPEILMHLHDKNFAKSFANALLAVAISLRVASDRTKDDVEEIHRDALAWVIPPAHERQSVTRECCNRVIHASWSSFIIRPFTERPRSDEDPFIPRERGSGGTIWLELAGEEKQVRWFCRLDVLEFLDAAARSATKLRLREVLQQAKLMKLLLGRHSTNEDGT